MTRRVMGLLLVTGLVLLSACGGSSEAPDPVPSAPSVSASGTGIDQPTASVADLSAAIDQFVTTDSGPWINTRAVLVSHRGELIAERYYFSEAEERAEVLAVTTTVIATLVGIALADGALSLDQTLGELLPKQQAAMTAETRRTTVRHLLTMASGRTPEQVDQIDPRLPGYVTSLLKLPAKVPPGTEMNYNDGDPHLLSAVLRERTGKSPLDYAREKLFGPLGIQTDPAHEGPLGTGGSSGLFAWPTDGDGLSGGGYGMQLTARDMLTLGELYRNEGVWKGRRILDSTFVAEATEQHFDLPQGGGYGYLCWVTPYAGLDAYSFIGRFGQLVFVVPSRDLTVVISTRPSGEPLLEHGDELAMVEQLVLPRLS